MKQTGFKILFVVCHPDDEALWVGGLISELSKLPDHKVYVCCLTGNDDNSPRPGEFSAAQKVAGYAGGVVVGGALRRATERLSSIESLLESGLQKLQIDARDVDLLITHSPYGDEHMNPHHTQACKELYRWSRSKKVPFGYFSCVPLTHALHISILYNLKRSGSLHLLQMFRCSYSIGMNFVRLFQYKPYLFPKYFFSFLVDSERKKKMLECYPSINVPMHKEGYAMFTSNSESVYLMDQRGADVFKRVSESMSVPGSANLFLYLWRPGIGIIKFLRKITGVRDANPS